MNTFDFAGVQNQAVVVGAAAIVANTITLPGEKPGCSNLLVSYAPGVPGRTLTIAIELGNSLGTIWLAPQSSSSTSVTASAAVAISLSGGPAKFRIKISSAGAAGANDTVSFTFQGLPTGTVVA
jgi:hypothetical protein